MWVEMAERWREGRADARRGAGIMDALSWWVGGGRMGRVVWVLDVGEREGESEDVWEAGTLRFALLVLEASVSVSTSSVPLVSEDVLRDFALIAVSLATASLMWAGTRTQAKVRS